MAIALAAAVLSCNLVTQTTNVPATIGSDPTATRAAANPTPRHSSSLEGQLAGVAGLPPLELVAADASSLAPANEQFATALEELGSDADSMRFELARTALGEPGGLRLGAVTWPGRDWTAALQAFAAAAGLSLEPVATPGGGAFLLEPSAETDELAPVTYAISADSLLFIESEDEELVGRILAAATGLQEPSARAPRRARPAPQSPGPLLLVPLGLPPGPACVGDPSREHLVDLLILDASTAVPSPMNIVSARSRLGRLEPPPSYTGPNLIAFYLAERYESGGFDSLLLEITTPHGGYGMQTYDIPVQHCLGGSWQDGDRILELSHDPSGLVRATVANGELCGDTAGPAFSGTLDGDRLTGNDLKVCNPEECVQAGLIPASLVVDYEAVVAGDGQSVSIDWQGDFFEVEYNEEDNVLSCMPTSVEQHSFSISRLGYGVP